MPWKFSLVNEFSDSSRDKLENTQKMQIKWALRNNQDELLINYAVIPFKQNKKQHSKHT